MCRCMSVSVCLCGCGVVWRLESKFVVDVWGVGNYTRTIYTVYIHTCMSTIIIMQVCFAPRNAPYKHLYIVFLNTTYTLIS